MWFWLFGVCASVSCINNEQHEQREQMTLVVFNLKLSQKDSLISFRQHCGLLLFICYIFTFLKTPLLSRTTDKMSKSLTCDFSSLWVCLCVYACCAAWKVRFFIHHTSVSVCLYDDDDVVYTDNLTSIYQWLWEQTKDVHLIVFMVRRVLSVFPLFLK